MHLTLCRVSKRLNCGSSNCCCCCICCCYRHCYLFICQYGCLVVCLCVVVTLVFLLFLFLLLLLHFYFVVYVLVALFSVALFPLLKLLKENKKIHWLWCIMFIHLSCCIFEKINDTRELVLNNFSLFHFSSSFGIYFRSFPTLWKLSRKRNFFFFEMKEIAKGQMQSQFICFILNVTWHRYLEQTWEYFLWKILRFLDF